MIKYVLMTQKLAHVHVHKLLNFIKVNNCCRL